MVVQQQRMHDSFNLNLGEMQANASMRTGAERDELKWMFSVLVAGEAAGVEFFRFRPVFGHVVGEVVENI